MDAQRKAERKKAFSQRKKQMRNSERIAFRIAFNKERRRSAWRIDMDTLCGALPPPLEKGDEGGF